MTVNLMENFQRDIRYLVASGGEGLLLLTATMKDRFHDITLDVKVNLETLVIEAIIVDFKKSPEELCSNATTNLQKMVGVTIGRGLTRAIMNAMGGGEGCVNLRHLLSGLLPLAMNVKAAKGFSDQRAMLDNIREKLAGACAGYPSLSNNGVA